MSATVLSICSICLSSSDDCCSADSCAMDTAAGATVFWTVTVSFKVCEGGAETASTSLPAVVCVVTDCRNGSSACESGSYMKTRLPSIYGCASGTSTSFAKM